MFLINATDFYTYDIQNYENKILHIVKVEVGGGGGGGQDIFLVVSRGSL